jgi:hypothetical protein
LVGHDGPARNERRGASGSINAQGCRRRNGGGTDVRSCPDAIAKAIEEAVDRLKDATRAQNWSSTRLPNS